MALTLLLNPQNSVRIGHTSTNAQTNVCSGIRYSVGVAIETYFRECIEFFFPTATEIDWERGYNFLDKELQQRFVDKFVQVWLKDVTEQWVLIHLEVQSY